MDPYRESVGGCPACGFGLRPFNGRSVCDGCGGMLIRREDLLGAMADSDARALEVTTGDEVEGSKCPGCGHLLRRAKLIVDKHELEQEVGSCERDGLWFPSGALVVVLAEVGKRAGTKQPAIAFAVPRWANAAAYGGGIIGRGPKAKPMVHTPLPLAHKGKALHCPDCRSALVQSGLTWMCSRHGALIEEAALDAMIGEMTGSPWEPPAWTGAAGARPCPACATPMAVEHLDGIEVDRCAADGIWMDPGELEGVLARSSDRGRKGWVSRLFRRST